MPNPVKVIKSTKGMRPRQKAIYTKVKRAGLTPVGYFRRKYRSGSFTKSVHDPFLDISRTAKKAGVPTVKRYPQARDTPRQHDATRKQRVRISKLRGRVKSKSIFKGLLFP